VTDIVERLREGCGCNYPETTCMAESECADAFEAADEIERLRNVLENVEQARVLQGKAIIDADKEIERLRAALERIAFGKYHWEADAQEEARAALGIVDLDDVLAPPRKDTWV
jgi:hypothetical protein